MKMSRARRVVAEFFGTAFPVAAVIGSGVMGERFYNAFLKTYFVTIGELQKIKAPDVKLNLLGPESGWESARTLPWYWKQPDSSIILHSHKGRFRPHLCFLF